MTEKVGSLIVVGTGIKSPSQCTLSAKYEIEAADVVYFSLPDPLAEEWVKSLNNNAHSMLRFYQEGVTRLATYRQMTRTLIEAVESGKRVCGVFYGHPGVFVSPAHAAVQYLTRRGFQAQMHPGVSAEDCLFADLHVDPSHQGCQAIEATSYLLYQRQMDPCMPLIVWQIGALGDLRFIASQADKKALAFFIEKLQRTYSASHQICVYEAAVWEVSEPRCDWMPLTHLIDCPLSAKSTLFIPPCDEAPADHEYLQKCGLAAEKRYSRNELNRLLCDPVDSLNSTLE